MSKVLCQLLEIIHKDVRLPSHGNCGKYDNNSEPQATEDATDSATSVLVKFIFEDNG